MFNKLFLVPYLPQAFSIYNNPLRKSDAKTRLPDMHSAVYCGSQYSRQSHKLRLTPLWRLTDSSDRRVSF